MKNALLNLLYATMHLVTIQLTKHHKLLKDLAIIFGLMLLAAVACGCEILVHSYGEKGVALIAAVVVWIIWCITDPYGWDGP